MRRNSSLACFHLISPSPHSQCNLQLFQSDKWIKSWILQWDQKGVPFFYYLSYHALIYLGEQPVRVIYLTDGLAVNSRCSISQKSAKRAGYCAKGEGHNASSWATNAHWWPDTLLSSSTTLWQVMWTGCGQLFIEVLHFLVTVRSNRENNMTCHISDNI